jgi:mRNA interferase YafQ
MEKLKAVFVRLIEGAPLEARFCDHVLAGNFKGRRECHLEPGWLLIYKLEADDAVIFERTGSHADLFE